MTYKSGDHNTTQNNPGNHLLAKCLRLHADEIASRVNRIRDKDGAEEPIKVYESFGKKEPEKMESRGSAGQMMTRLPSAVNKELSEKMLVYNYIERGLRKISYNFIVGNLPPDVTEQDIRFLVQDCGQLRSCIIRKHSEANRINIYAQLEYRYEVECIEVFRTLMGRLIHVDWCDDYHRQKYPDLVSATSSLFPKFVAENPFEISERPPVFDDLNPCMVANKLHLIDNKGCVTPYGLELAQKMDLNDIFNLVSKIYKLSQRTPSVARALLTENPSACHVLLQSQSLLGNPPKILDLDSINNINSESFTLSKSLEYFVNID